MMDGYFSIMGNLDWLSDPIRKHISKTATTRVEITCGRGELVWMTPPVESEVLNDKDTNLMRLHSTVQRYDWSDPNLIIRTHPDYNFILDKDQYDYFRGLTPAEISDFHDLHFLYVYLYLMRGGKHGDEIFKDVFHPSMQGKNFSGIIKRVARCSQRLKNVKLDNLDAVEAIGKYDSKDTFFFIDPPYPSRERYYRVHDLQWGDLVQKLRQVQGKWMLICEISLSPRVGTAIRNKERIRYIIESHNALMQLLCDYPHHIYTENFRAGWDNLSFTNRKKMYAMITNYELPPQERQLFLL